MPPCAFKTIGFIGLGLMGKPMARNLMKAGYPMTVKSRSPGPVRELVAEGAVAADSPREVAERSDLVITMLPNSPEVQEVCLGPGGAIEAARAPGFQDREIPLTIVDMSTISPSVSISIGKKLAEAGIDYLEAPVSGGDVGAIKGSLSIMVGGPEAVFDRVMPAFDIMGQSSIRVGQWGAGQTTKLANNIICAATIESVAEAFVLGAKAGLDPVKMYEAIRGGAAQCWSMDMKAPKWANRDFNPGFMCKLHLKDLNLALDAGEEMEVPLPVTKIIRDMLKELVDEGRGEEDNGALVNHHEKRAHTEVRRHDEA